MARIMWVSFIWIKPVGRIGHSMLNWLVIYLLNKLAWILINVPRDVPCQISHCCFYPVAVLRNGQNMALLWTKHGPHMVPKSGSSWFLINVPRDTQCQISHSPGPRHCCSFPFRLNCKRSGVAPSYIKKWPFLPFKSYFSFNENPPH